MRYWATPNWATLGFLGYSGQLYATHELLALGYSAHNVSVSWAGADLKEAVTAKKISYISCQGYKYN